MVRHPYLRSVRGPNPIIAWSPKSLLGCAAFPDTSPAIGNANERSTDSCRSARADRRSRCRASEVSHDNWPAAAFPDCPTGASLPRPIYRWLARKQLRRAPLRQGPYCAKAGFALPRPLGGWFASDKPNRRTPAAEAPRQWRPLTARNVESPAMQRIDPTTIRYFLNR